MATFYSTLPETGTMSSSVEPQSSSTPKLRDSCGACAASKLKCHRQKPVCSRCAKRGIVCSYVATRRKGRKSASQSSQSTTQDRQKSDLIPSGTLPNSMNATSPGSSMNSMAPPLDMWFTTDNSFPCGDYSVQSSGSTSGASTSVASYSAHSDGLLSMNLSELMTDIDDCFPLLGSPFMADQSNFDFLNQQNSFFTDIGHTKIEDTGFLPPPPPFENNASDQSSLSGICNLINNDIGDTHLGWTETNSCCVFQAIDLIRKLFPNSSSSCKYSESKGNAYSPSTTHNVLATNQKTIEAISGILQCSCSQDGFMLAMISLIIFKMLNWYAAAARQAPLWRNNANESPQYNQSPNSNHQISPEQVLPDPIVAESPDLEGEDPAYMAAQKVLSELHCVQRLVNQLSIKLKEHRSRGSKSPEFNTTGLSEDRHTDSSLPFSASMLDQLDGILRRRLKSLSGEVVELLRRE